MILGDNIFFGNSFSTLLRAAVKNADENGRATVFGYYVPDSGHFSVVAFDKEGHVTSIEKSRRVIIRLPVFTSIRQGVQNGQALLSHLNAENVKTYGKSPYGEYLMAVARRRVKY